MISRVLAELFVDKYCREMKKPDKSLTERGAGLLEKYHWPGNVRELENTIERAVILAEGQKITPEHLAIRLQRTEEIQLRDGAGLKEIGAHAQMQAERGDDHARSQASARQQAQSAQMLQDRLHDLVRQDQEVRYRAGIGVAAPGTGCQTAPLLCRAAFCCRCVAGRTASQGCWICPTVHSGDARVRSGATTARS